MEARPTTNKEAPLVVRHLVPPPTNQVPNDRVEKDRGSKWCGKTLQKVNEGSKQYGEASLQGMERHSQAVDIQKVQAIH